MEISSGDAKQMGVTTQHELMENGERRFRLVSADGSSYVRTEASPSGGWQQSHCHETLIETYIVQTGWMALAELVEDRLRIRIFECGEAISTSPGVSHNVYLSSNTIIHTVKHSGARADWIPDRDLDDRTRQLCEAEILRIGQHSNRAREPAAEAR